MFDPDLIRDRRIGILANYFGSEYARDPRLNRIIAETKLRETGMRDVEISEALSGNDEVLK